MKRFVILIVVFSFLSFLIIGTPTRAQTPSSSDNHTARAALLEGEPRLDHTRREEAEGKEVWEKLQAKQLECKNLTDEQYGSLGEYFMGQSVGDTQRHAAMNQMMTSMMGEEGEEQMHVTLGKRASGCDTNASFQVGSAFAPWSFGGTKGGGNPMMGYGGWGNLGFGWVFMIIFWILIILGVVALVRYLSKPGSNKDGKTPLDILKERYASGEINKKEFDEKKKDLK